MRAATAVFLLLGCGPTVPPPEAAPAAVAEEEVETAPPVARETIPTSASAVVAGGPPGPRPIAIAAGGHHACAAFDTGEVRCFGDNVKGQLSAGFGLRGFLPPRQVPGVRDAVGVAAGEQQSCAIAQSGDVTCWGDGRPPTFPGARTPFREGAEDQPVRVELTAVAQLAFGLVAGDVGRPGGCAVHRDGTVSCWGWSEHGDVPAVPGSSAGQQRVARTVAGLEPATQVDVGASSACARTSERRAACWGSNRAGQLGDGTETDSRTARTVVGLSGVEEVACGIESSCARLQDGGVACWGTRSLGQLGDGRSDHDDPQPTPLRVPGLADVARIGSGGAVTCALRRGGDVWCWGLNTGGVVGVADPGARQGRWKTYATPTRVPAVADAVDLAVGDQVACVIRRGGEVDCWGQWDLPGVPALRRIDR